MLPNLKAFRSQSLLSLALLIALLVLSYVAPTSALGRSTESEPSAGLPYVTKSDITREPTVVTDGGSSKVAERELRATANTQLATLQPYVFFDNVEGGTGSFSANSPWAITEEWQPVWLGPGNHSWSDSPGGDYANNYAGDLISGVIDLSGIGTSQAAYLSFAFKSDLNANDRLLVFFSDDGGTSWTWYGDEITGYEEDGWFSVQIPSAECTDLFRFALEMETDASGTGDGVHIDYLSVDADPTDWMQEDDLRLAYLGNWATGSGTAYNEEGGSWTWYHKYTSTPGDVLRLNFNGPAIHVYGKMGPEYGIATVSLDGGTPQQVDFYVNPEWATDYYMYPFWVVGYNTLSDGPHTLTICCTGNKNPASTGYRVSFESAYIWGEGASAPPALHVEQFPDPELKYTGPAWNMELPDAAASGGSLATVNAPGSALNVEFEGTYLAWNAKRGPGFGKAKVSVDDGPLQTVDLYYPWNWSKQRVFNTGLLSGGTHTLSIYWSGLWNSASPGTTAIDVDSFDVYDVLGTADDASPLVDWRYQETDPYLTFVGDWGNSGDTGWRASGNSYKFTSQYGATMYARFYGTKVNVIGKKCPWYGTAQVTIDGGTGSEISQEVDFYSTNWSQDWKTVVYGSPVLSEGWHTLTIECLDDSTVPGSSYTTIGVDALDVTGYLAQASKVTRVQDDDYGFCTYDPIPVPTPPPGETPTGWLRWDDSHYWAASEDTYAYTDQFGYKVTVDFHGKCLSWVACTSPTKGRARVTVDPGPGEYVCEVDLYSPTTEWKKRVFCTGPLGDGYHTVVIECLETKNPLSWWYTIGVDAFDMVRTAE